MEQFLDRQTIPQDLIDPFLDVQLDEYVAEALGISLSEFDVISDPGTIEDIQSDALARLAAKGL